MKNNQIQISQLKLLNSRQLFDIEVTTRCNKHCYCCPRQRFIRKQTDMSMNTFNKLLVWLPNECDVYLAGFGEPLLHNDVYKFIEKLADRKIRVSIMTNAILLDKDKIQQLFYSGLHKLQVSILKNEKFLIDKILSMTETKDYNKLQFNLLNDTGNEIKKVLLNIYYLKK